MDTALNKFPDQIIIPGIQIKGIFPDNHIISPVLLQNVENGQFLFPGGKRGCL